MRTRVPLLLFLAAAVFAPACANLHWQRQRLAPGLGWRHTHTQQLFHSKQSIQVLDIDTRKRRLSLAFVTDTFLPTSRLAQDSGALAAVNAGFFKIREGRGSATYLRVRGRTVDDMPAQGHPRLNGALILRADGHGAPGIEYARPNAAYNADTTGQTVLVTGPVLLLDGKAQALESEPEFNVKRHPRTCACTRGRNRLLLVTVDGRHENQADGMSLFELTGLMKTLRCRNAINLDGGGSTTLWIRGQPDNGVVNYPSDNKKFDHFGERPVMNALLVH